MYTLVTRVLPAALFGLILGVGEANAQNRVSTDRLAYESYVGCYNQARWLYDKSDDPTGLLNDLDSCRQLARTMLTISKSAASARYLAYLTLLNTDGGESEQNNEAIAKKGRAIRPYLQEVRKLAGRSPCVASGTEIQKPAVHLCASDFNAIRTIDLHLRQ